MQESMSAYFRHTLTDEKAYGNRSGRVMDFMVRCSGEQDIFVFSNLVNETNVWPCDIAGFEHLLIGALLSITTMQPFNTRDYSFAVSGEVIGRRMYKGVTESGQLDEQEIGVLVDEAQYLYENRQPIRK